MSYKQKQACRRRMVRLWKDQNWRKKIAKSTKRQWSNPDFASRVRNPMVFFNYLRSNYRCGAARRNLPFELTPEQIAEIVIRPCFYCGSMPEKSKWAVFIERGRAVYRRFSVVPDHHGIDRVENSKGYTLDNVVSCCSICNVAKRTMSKDAFLEWAKRLAHHQGWI